MDTILASTFGVSNTNQPDQNGNLLRAAIAAAAQNQTELLLPAGDIRFSGDLTLPKNFSGSLSIRGLGDKVTRLVPVGNCNGLDLDLSYGAACNNSVNLSNFGLVANTGPAGRALRISYGTQGLASVENQPGSKVTDVSVYGAGWTHGALFEECWHMRTDNLYLYGGENYKQASALGKGDGGPGSGIGLQVLGGVNNTFSAIVTEFFGQGIVLSSQPGTVGRDSQGISFDDVQMVECIEGFHAYGTGGGFLATIELINWMIDNGNLDVAGHSSIIFENCTDAWVAYGQGLQKGGSAPNIKFLNCQKGWIQNNSLEFRANTTGPNILITGNSRDVAIEDNTISGTIQLDSDTHDNYIDRNPGATIVDTGTGNIVVGAPTKLINISTRGFVGTGGNIMIAGFVISGSSPKTVLIRATGPTLAAFGMTGVLPDPKLDLTTATGTAISTNTKWGGSSQIAATAAQVGAFAWPANSADSAILVTLQPGNYTALVSGASGTTGDVLLEVYDVA